MPWLSQADAARMLGVSSRTMARRLAEGQFRTRREGRTVEVYLPAPTLLKEDDPAAGGLHVRASSPRTLAWRLADGPFKSKRKDRYVEAYLPEPVEHDVQPEIPDSGMQLAKVAAFAAIQKKHDADIIKGALSAVEKSRVVLEEDAARARGEAERNRAETQQVREAQSRTQMAGRWVVGIAALLVLAAAGGTGWIAFQYHSMTVAHADEVTRLNDALAGVEGRYQGELSAAKSQAHALQEAHDRSTLQLQERLQEQFANRATQLAKVQAQRDALLCDLDEARVDLQTMRDELTDLKSQFDVQVCELPIEGPPTLKEVIDASWEAPDFVGRRWSPIPQENIERLSSR